MQEENNFKYNDQLLPVPYSSQKDKLISLGTKTLVTKNETREILTEEKYVKNLEKIIVRDYFPELPKLKV